MINSKKVNSSVIKKSFPVAYDLMKRKKIRKCSVSITGKLHISEDTTYTLVAPDKSTKVIKVGGEWGGMKNTHYICKEYQIPEGYYAVSVELFLGKWIITVYTPDQTKIV